MRSICRVGVVHLVTWFVFWWRRLKRSLTFFRNNIAFPRENPGYAYEFAHPWKKILRAPTHRCSKNVFSRPYRADGTVPHYGPQNAKSRFLIDICRAVASLGELAPPPTLRWGLPGPPRTFVLSYKYPLLSLHQSFSSGHFQL